MTLQKKLVCCDHCGKEVPIDKARKTKWEGINHYWYYCNRCEIGVFGGKSAEYWRNEYLKLKENHDRLLTTMRHAILDN
ncbi:hypothetical protein PZE06_21465 [Robertmurraya sp. DFI.2.37]|uniref:hypothetical protein n=1 Tax=Robertmurraya sp. DFI.2.37 TaxID=3031819 RepID=UPI001244AC43|nr:hypothetical protein [Robertmurraya sp. DFI.2.37]MDF1510708.1 hypothetical protein [Robertmurraya sp. DFI.2.37]